MLFLLTFFGSIKGIFSNILSFIITPLGKVISIILIIVSSLWFTYNKGFTNGTNDQIALHEKDYKVKLEIALSKYKLEQSKADKKGIELQDKQDKVKTITKTKILEIHDIVKDNKSVKEAELNDDEYLAIIKKLEEIK